MEDLLSARMVLGRELTRSKLLKAVLVPKSSVTLLQAREPSAAFVGYSSFVGIPLHFLPLVGLLMRHRSSKVLCLGWKAWLSSLFVARLFGAQAVIGWVRELGALAHPAGWGARLSRSIVLLMLRLSSLGARAGRLQLWTELWQDAAQPESRRLIPRSIELQVVSSQGVELGQSSALQPSNQAPLVVFLGDLSWKQRLGEVLQGCGILWDEGLSFTLHFAGVSSAPDAAHIPDWLLSRWMERWPSHVFWHQKSESSESLIAKADVAVQGGHEGLDWAAPTSLVRAGARGLPLLVPNEPYFRRFVIPEKSGDWVDATSPQDWAKKLRPLVARAEKRKEMGSFARQDVVDRWERGIVLRRQLAPFTSVDQR